MFIVIEGGEGAGKSSLALALESRLSIEGKEVVWTREPGGTPFGESLRSLILSSSISTYTELFLFLASRSQHIHEKIAPAVASGKIVICERFHDSTIVYQGLASGLGVEYVANFCYQVVGVHPFLPDLTILLDLPPEEGLLRKCKQKSLDRFEERSLEYHRRIREGFLSLALRDPERHLVLDATRPLEKSISEVMARISALCN
ncbi:thymidylate kinase [Chlamydia ibidis]|uniref:Thymidylate kinase n=2 Tax=Chlamydia ibidis TaxID=1405396 RepID=S7J3V7_9CHLA|nr:dTMP kinase [Chlamydia ibidis]EPP35104.1 thymidylate kinase [Chlamydia ibidis]EQM62770.1 thymidylate kinase [Chlamydia ibidis 10-1398/6]